MSDATRGGGIAGPAALMFTGTAASRVLGLVRNAVLALVLTVNVAGAANAFSVANKLPNVIFMLVAGGVLNAVLVPQIVRAMRREDGGKEYVDRLLTMAGAALAALTLVLTAASSLLVALYGQRLGEWFPVAVAFAYWCIPQLFFYGLYTLLGQVLNARSSFGPYMWAPVVNNIVAIIGLGVFIAVFGTAATNEGADPAAWTPGRIALLAGTATAGVAAQALILLVPLYRSGFRWSPRWGWRGTGLGRASRVATWAFFGLAVGQLGYVVVSNVAAAAGTAGGTSALVAGNAAYDNAFLVFMLPQSLITVSLVTALFTRMSANAAADDLDKVRADLSFGLRTVAVFTVFATGALAVLALPVVRVVLPTVTFDEARSVAAVTLTMLLGLSGLGAWTLVQRVYYAFEDTRSLFFVQIPMAAIVAVGALAAAFLLEPQWWVPGAGLAMSVSSWTGALVAYRRLRGRLGTLDAPRVLRTHVRLVLATVPAALAGWGLLHLLGVGAGPDARAPAIVTTSLLRVAAVGALMVVGYVVLLRVVRVEELDALARPVERLLRGPLRRVRTMTRGRRAGSVAGARGGETVSGTVTSDTVARPRLLDDGTVLAGRFRLTEPFPIDLAETTAWHGHDLVLDRPVRALRLRGRTMAEALDSARRAALVEDPRLCRVLSVGTHEGEGFVVTEVVRGRDLGRLVAEEGPLPPEVARAVVGEAASALEAARRRGVHHLALRPSSLFFDRDAGVTITGIGFDAAQLGHAVPDFWVASRQDAVALVSLLYLALTGVDPQQGEDGAFVPPADLSTAVPNDLDTLCVVTLSGHDDGPHSPAEVMRELAPWPDLDTIRRHSAHQDDDRPPASPPVEGGRGGAPPPAPGGGDAPRSAAEPTPPGAGGLESRAHRDWQPAWIPVPDDGRRPPFGAVLTEPVAHDRKRPGLTAPIRTARHSSGSGVADRGGPGVGARVVGVAAAAGHTVTATGRAVGAAGRATGHAVGTAGRATGHAVATAGRATGHAVAVAGRATGRVVARGAAAIGRTVARVWTVTARALATAGRATGRAATATAVAVQVRAAKTRAWLRRVAARASSGARFDPTPYVLALMVGLVLFGTIWAVGVLTPEPQDGQRARPAVGIEEAGPTPTAPAEEQGTQDQAPQDQAPQDQAA